jgi:hypothetical protein
MSLDPVTSQCRIVCRRSLLEEFSTTVSIVNKQKWQQRSIECPFCYVPEYDSGHRVFWQIQVFYGMKLLFWYKTVFVFKTIQNNHFWFLIIVELATSQVLLHWPKQVICHKSWSFCMMQRYTALSDTIVVTILTSGSSTLLFGLLKQHISCS